MVLLKNIPAVLLSIIIVFQAQAKEINDQKKVKKKQNDVQLLMAFLSQEQSGREQRQKAQELINRGQVFFLNYDRDEPLMDDSDHKDRETLKRTLGEKGIFVIGTSHHIDDKIYPGLYATFSRLSTYNNPEPKNWLEQMKLPVDAGYELKSVRIVYLPSKKIKKQTFEKCTKVVTQIDNELQKLKPEFKQFAEYDKVILSAGKWDNGDWPRYYPNFSYRYGYGDEIPNTKGMYEKTTENWCLIRIGFVPVRGDPKAQIHGSRTYSRQGIEASWNVESGNEELNTRISSVIIKYLSVLDEYEEELENRQLAHPAATNKMLESLKPLEYWLDSMKEPDRELARKWDLPEYVLGVTSTDMLFLHFIKTPMKVMIMIHSEEEMGVQRLLNSSTTLREFYMREDLAEGALKMYREYDLAPDNITKAEIVSRYMNIWYADSILLSPQFFPKLKGYEREFLKVMLERYEKVAQLREQKIYGENESGGALGCWRRFCRSLAKNLDEEFYTKLKAIKTTNEAGKKQFIEEIKNYLGK